METINPYQFEITISTKYLSDQSDTQKNCYTFAYTVLIKNIGTEPAKLMGRHWIITDADGQVQEVRGVGVVGEQPYLKPGESFQYSSSAIINTPVGSMQGNYSLVSDDGTFFKAEIPAFSLAKPNILN